jgi:quercetin dioxygenase-like cupin family protein
MPTLIPSPTLVEAAGTPPKRIREVTGRVNTSEPRLSIAHMTSPPGWSEPWQRPEFDEWSYVLSGAILVEHDGDSFQVTAGQAVHVAAGERVRYSAPDTVHRED